MENIKNNYPLFTPVDAVWADIFAKIDENHNTKKRYWLLSRFVSYKKVIFWLFLLVVWGVGGILTYHKSNTSDSIAYNIDELDSLTQNMMLDLSSDIQTINWI